MRKHRSGRVSRRGSLSRALRLTPTKAVMLHESLNPSLGFGPHHTATTFVSLDGRETLLK